jgi:peptidoglycan/LPS O-acetylase OafA/YrhL
LDKIIYLEELRGCAAFIAFLAHFVMAFPIPSICLFFIISGFYR